VPVKVDSSRLGAPAEPRYDGPQLRVEGLTKSFTPREGGGFLKAAKPVRVVEDVSFSIPRGQTLGLVGESGSGKTTVGKMIVRAITPDSGTILLDGEDVLTATGAKRMEMQRRVQMVFQDPVSSLSPHMTIGSILTEPLEVHAVGDRASRKQIARDLMRAVGLPERDLSRYPHSFSGGQRQRIGIARALALGPELIVCDEATSALDVSVQAQVLNLLKDLQKDLGLTYLFISHNLAVVNYMSDQVAVMQQGRIVEIGPRDIVMQDPVHPYTRALLAAVPYPDLDRPLDFAMLARGSRPQDWAPAFRGERLVPLDLGAGHQVLAQPGADLAELRA
jgi:peptide/nickel transport system ATP-binding protein